ncbi:hypothetical protein H4582DRAFT_2003916 [Lactarius indigo]|nr:hypothetical protein H4582DRAFT_2003916 [Lactarius indigo]
MAIKVTAVAMQAMVFIFHIFTRHGWGCWSGEKVCNPSSVTSKGHGTSVLLDIVSHSKLGVIRGSLFCSEALRASPI